MKISISRAIAVAGSLACLLAPGAPTLAQSAAPPALTAEEAQSIAKNAYVYFYPLISMEITRRISTNSEPGALPGKGPGNWFNSLREYPAADFKAVVRPNFDTLYSQAWLDLSKEPMVLSVPDTDGRYYLMPMLDMWSDVFASPGWRTTGTQAGTYLIAAPGWRPDLREGFVEEFKLPEGTQRIDATTPVVWIITRIKTDGPADYAAVNKLQDGFKVTPLSQWDKTSEAPKVEVDASIDMKTPPKQQVDDMAGPEYFALAAEVLKTNPPHATDEPMLAQLRKLGFEVGQSFDAEKAAPEVKAAIEAAPKAGQEMMLGKMPTLAPDVNGWSMNVDTMGVYGNYYLKRAIVANVGLGANLPEDAIYPLNLTDSEGKPLDGNNNYVIHFPKDQTPPAHAFWSVTLYDSDGFQVANSLNRFAVSSYMPFVRNSDGSLDIYIQNESPGPDKEANWLPSPKEPISLTLRLYAPDEAALLGKWSPPPVELNDRKATLVTQ